jgi:hypothetical protein
MEKGKPGRCNGCDRFQIITTAIVVMGMMSFGYIEYALGFLELMPDF